MKKETIIRKAEGVFHLFSSRPLVLLAVFLSIGIGFGKAYGGAFTIFAALFGAALLAAVILLAIKKNALIAIMLTAFFLGAALCSFVANPGCGYIPPKGESVMIKGTIAELPERSGGQTAIILGGATVEHNGVDMKLGGRLRLKVEGGETLKYGQTITANATYDIPENGAYGFDRKQYLLTRGIWYEGRAKGVHATGAPAWYDVYGLTLELRTQMEKTIDALYNDTSSTMKGMLLGDKSDISEEGMDAFRTTGTAHLLAVSGMNVGFIAAAIYFLMYGLARSKPRLHFYITVLVLAVHCIITGLSPPVLRATLMAIVIIGGRSFGQKPDTPSALAISYIIILAINPLWLFDAGFQLSYAGVAGILFITKRVETGLKRLPKWFKTTLGATLGGQAGTLPISALHFGSISVLGLIVNLVAIPLSGVLVILGFLSVILGMVYLPLGIPFAFIAKGILLAMLSAIVLGAKVPLMSVDIRKPPWWYFLTYFGFLYSLSHYMVVGKKARIISAGILGAACAGATLFLVL